MTFSPLFNHQFLVFHPASIPCATLPAPISTVVTLDNQRGTSPKNSPIRGRIVVAIVATRSRNPSNLAFSDSALFSISRISPNAPRKYPPNSSRIACCRRLSKLFVRYSPSLLFSTLTQVLPSKIVPAPHVIFPTHVFP